MSMINSTMKNAYNVKHGGTDQVVAIWLKGQMKCLVVMDKCKVVVDINMVAEGKDMVVVVVHKDMNLGLVHKNMDMDMVEKKWMLAVMVGQ